MFLINRNEIPSKGVLALNMGLARVKRPVDFKLVWSSFDLSSSLHRGMNANGSANSLYGVVMAEEGLSGSNRADGKSFLDEDGEDQEQECSVWLPIPSPGYVALGCVASRGREPPSPTTALCVLATLVTPCSMKDCIYVSTQNL
jgi:vacuolar protein sorting-associated protein 13A/C